MESTPSSRMVKVCLLMDFIDQHISEDLTLEVLARHVDCSSAHLVRMFQQETGETPGDFVRRIRLERAANYLWQNRHVPLVDIALACGFLSAAVFSRSFREWFGMTPSQWRAGAHWKRCFNESCWRAQCGDCSSGIEDFSALPQIQSLALHPFARGKPESLDFAKVRIVEMPRIKLAYLRGGNASKIGGWLPLWQRFREWESGVRQQGQQPLTAAMHFLDNHNICKRQHARVDIGIILDENAGPGMDLCKTIEGGRYALLPFRGTWIDYVLACEYAWLTLFAILGVSLDIHRPFLKLFDLSVMAAGDLPDLAAMQTYEALLAFPVRKESGAVPEWWYRTGSPLTA